MKKILSLTLCMMFVTVSFSQEQTSSASNGSYAPVAGDIAIGVDAMPYIKFLGNAFNGTTNNSLNIQDQSIYMRYHLSDNSAVRAIVRINSGLDILRYYVQDDAAVFANPLSKAQVEDKLSINTSGYEINLGYQISRGSGKVKGFFGGQLGYGFSRTQYTYAYGNNITVANPVPSSTWFFGAERSLEVDFGLTQSISGGLLLGAEYYFLPKVCLGGELGLTYRYSWGSQENTKSEKLVGTQVEKIDKATSPGDKSHEFGTANLAPYSSLYVLFHF